MSGDTLTTLGKFLPTLLALVIIAYCFIRGLMRGFRKSIILILNYTIGIIVGFLLYKSVRSMLMTSDINWILSKVGNVGGMDFSDAHSFYDAAEVVLKQFMPTLSGAVENPNIQQVIASLAGLAVSLVTGIICLIIVPIIVRFILYLVYLLFLREGKFKRNKIAEGDDYRPHRLLGGVTGLIRGFATAALTVSFVTSLFFIVSGGITKSSEEEVKDIDLLEDLGDKIGVDLNAIYRGVAQSRSTGIGLIFDNIKIKEKPIDLYYTDLFLGSSFTTYPKQKDDVKPVNSYLSDVEQLEGELAQLYLREELTLMVNLLIEIYESGAITIVDGKVKLDEQILQDEITVLIDEFVHNSVLISEITPLTIIGLAESIHEGKVDLGEINELFDEETVESIKAINIPDDISKIFETAVNALVLLPVDEHTDEIDFDAFKDKNTYVSFDVDDVKALFTSLSEITLVTEVICPVGIGVAIQSMEEEIEAAEIEETDLDFTDVDWSKEIALLGNIYEKVVNLDLDLEKIFNMEKEEDSKVPVCLEYLIDLTTNDETSDEFKVNLLDLTDTIFSSDLYSQVALVVVKSQVAQLSFMHEDGTPSSLNDSLDLVKKNLSHYKKEHLRVDIHELISSCLDGTSLIPFFLEGTEPFDILYDVDTDDLRSALLGTYNSEKGEYEGGIYGIRLFNGDLDNDGSTDEDCYFATDQIIETALIAYASEIISPDTVDSVTKVNDPTSSDYDFDAWPNELDALINAIEELQTVDCLREIKFELAEDEDITDILPEALTNEDIDVITLAASKSILLSGVIKEKLINTLMEDDQIGYAVEDPSIVWMDTIKGSDVIYGELNSLLKAFKIFSEEEKGFDLNDENSLINGLSLLLHEATPEEIADPTNQNILYGLDYEEAIYFAKSQVLMTVLSKEVSEIGAENATEPDSTELTIIIPECLDTNIDKAYWKNWSYNGESNHDYKKGEFAKLVLVLYYAREYALANPAPVQTAETTEEKEYILTMDNLLHSVVHMDKDDYVTDSLVLYATTSDALVKQTSDVGSIIYVPTTALVEDAEENNDIEIQEEEIKKLFVVVRNLEINLINNDFYKIKLKIALDKIDEDEVRRSICVSKIFAASTINKISETEEIDIPRAYQKYNNESKLITDLESSVWYVESEETWYNCELNKILIGIDELGIEATEDDLFSVPKDDDLLKVLNQTAADGRTVLDCIYESKVFRTTISSRILEKEDILYRDNVLFDETFKVTDDRDRNIKQDEIRKLVVFLDESGISFEGGFDTAEIVDKLENEKVREAISVSNILNITLVDKISTAQDITIPDRFITDGKVDIHAEWYPVTDDAWEESEVAMILASVVELPVDVVDDQIKFPTDPTTLLKTLDGESKTEPSEGENKTKALKVVYRSEVIKATIKTKIEAEQTAGNISIRPQAYVESNVNNYFEYSEIELLSEFANAKDEEGNAANIQISSIKNKVVFDLLGVERNREIITTSNILNITVVERFDTAKDIQFPAEYLLSEDDPLTEDVNEQKVNPDTSLWYPSSNWKECELAKLLASVHELELASYVDPVTDEIKMPNTNGLLCHLNESSLTQSGTTRLDVVYGSDGISLTINNKIKNVDEIVVRQVAYEKIDGVYTDRIAVDEIAQLVDFVNFTNIDVDNHELDAEHLFALLKDTTPYDEEFTRGQQLRKMVVISNILNGTTVDKIGGEGVPSDDAAIKYASAYLNIDGTVNKELSAWYPKSSDTYQDCELYHMLVSVDELGINATGNQISLSINQNMDILLNTNTHNGAPGEKVIDIVYHSDNIAMTISDRLNHSTLEMPLKTYGNISIHEVTETRALVDKIIIEEEVEFLLEGLFSLGLEFYDENDPDHHLDYSHMFDNVELATLKTNIATVLNSSVMHYIISDNLINQVQTINAVDYSIVTYKAWNNSSTERTVTIVNDTCKYIVKNEITDALDVLDILGIQSIDDASNIDTSYLKDHFGSGATNRDTLINEVKESAIMSKIFSQILISNGILAGIEYTSGVTYVLKQVQEVADDDLIQTLTLVDLNTILTNNATAFDALG